MTRISVALLIATTATSAAVSLGMAMPVTAEPLADVCTNSELQNHRSCEVGYLAMYIPHGPVSDCESLYSKEVGLHPQDGLLEPDFLAGCEAAKRERIAKGVTQGLNP